MGDQKLDKRKRMRAMLERACEKAGAEKLAWKVLSIVPDEVLDELWGVLSEEFSESERKRAAKLLRSTSAELLLAAGEMTAQELRTVKAVLSWKASLILGPDRQNRSGGGSVGVGGDHGSEEEGSVHRP